MGKKGRNKKFGSAKETKIERGFTVVDENGRRIYLSSHPEGVERVEAERLSNGLAGNTRVVPIDQVG
jgi:hypothetical protein